MAVVAGRPGAGEIRNGPAGDSRLLQPTAMVASKKRVVRLVTGLRTAHSH